VRGRAAAFALALAAAASAGCVTDPWGDPVPGHETKVRIVEPGRPAEGRWPDAYRRGARFRVENATAAPIETLLLDFTGRGAPRELIEAEIEDPPGLPIAILPPEGGYYALRARLGVRGSVLLPPGGSLLLRVRVDGTPGSALAKFTAQ
jgi:hypothetical protein